MDLGMIAALLVLGTCGGFLAGLLGIGGGMILVPFITMLFAARGFPRELIVHMAIATSLATITFTSISSMRAHHQRGAVRWPIVKLLAPGILLGSWCGAWIGKQMDRTVLAAFFGLFVAFSATQMLLDRKPSPHRDLPKAPGMFGAGGVIGILSGLVGAGGGFVSVPFMTWCNVPVHAAVATSAALGFPIALAGTLSNIWNGMHTPGLPPGALGFIYLPALLVISLASVTMAPLGASAAHRMQTGSLKKVFAVVLYALAAYMFREALH
jgi:uncharacterized membrane protein YfcA